MPLKSTINIEADVDKFQQLNEIFDKYSESLKYQTDLWASGLAPKLLEVSKTQIAVTDYLKLQQPKESHISGFGAAVDKAGRAFRQLERDSKNIAEHLAKSASSLFQISVITGAVFGLLGSGFGVYVLDRAAGQVMDRRRTALGLGVGYAQLQSFGTNFGRFGIGEQTLGAAATGIYDVTSPQYLPLYATGAGGARNSADAIVQVLEKLPALFANTPQNQIGPKAEAYGLTNLLSVQQIITFLSASREEQQDTIRHYREDIIPMSLSANAQIAWSSFDTAMTRAGQNIESILAGTLVGLADPLTHLSESAVVLISAIIDSGAATKAVGALTTGIDWLAGEIDNGDAKEAMKSFAKGIEGLIPYIAWLGREFGTIMKWAMSLKSEELIPPGLGLPGLSIPTPGGHVFDNTPDTGAPGAPDTVPKVEERSNKPSLRQGTWQGPHTLPKDYTSGTVIDSTTGRKFTPDIMGKGHSPIPTTIPSIPEMAPVPKNASPRVTSIPEMAPVPKNASPSKVPEPIKINPPTEPYSRKKLDSGTSDAPGTVYYGSEAAARRAAAKDHRRVPESGPHEQQSINQFQGARTPYAVIVKNETGSSANVSTTRIPIAV